MRTLAKDLSDGSGSCDCAKYELVSVSNKINMWVSPHKYIVLKQFDYLKAFIEKTLFDNQMKNNSISPVQTSNYKEQWHNKLTLLCICQ